MRNSITHMHEGRAEAPEGFIDIDDARLRLEDEGRGFPVLLVHGWALDLDMWQPQVAAWTDRRRVIRYDRRGFGRSSGSSSLAADARDIESLVRRLCLTRVALIAMSQGARGAMHAAAGPLRGRIACLVLDGAPFDLSDSGEPEVPLDRYRELKRALGTDAVRAEWQRHPLAQLMTRDPAAHRLLALLTARYPGHDLATRPHAVECAALPVERIDVPTLVLNGTHDTPRRRAMGDELARALPRAERALVADAGHLPNLDNPAEYNRLVDSFIERHAAPRTRGTTDA
jgi:pimeloyl-ACP methyl ester carboxylesterase